MDSLKEKINQLKNGIRNREVQDKELRLKINTILSTVFDGVKLDGDTLFDYHLNNGNLYLTAKSKVIANELFLKKDQILKHLRTEKKIKNILFK
jgi:hypothetical protein